MAKLNGDSTVANELLSAITKAFQEITKTHFATLDSVRVKMDEGDLGYGYQINIVKSNITQNLQGVRTVATRLPRYIALLENGIAGADTPTSMPYTVPSIPQGAVSYGDNLYMVRDSVSNGQFFSAADHYEAYKEYWENLSIYTETPTGDKQTYFIRARDVEGVYLADREVENSEGFWTRNGRDGYSREAILAKARMVDSARTRFAAGEGIDSLCNDSSIGEAMGSYTSRPIRVSRLGNFYVFQGDGRHRVLASQSINGWIPVVISSEIWRK